MIAERKQSERRALGGDEAHGGYRRCPTAPCRYRAIIRLMAYWAEGEGAAKIQWGVSGDFARCEVELGKYVGPSIIAGLCANLHKRATGFSPGHAPGEHHG
jgi:hypothetical protein